MAITYLSNMSIDGTLTLTVNADADSTYTGIVVVESGLLKYRTKAQIKSDIGAGSGDGTITGSGTSGRLAKFNGSTALTNSRIFESVSGTFLYDTASYPFTIQNDGGINIFKFEGQAVSNSSNFQITPGTETKPGLNFGKRSGTGATDTNTGIYSSATDHLEISTGGSKALGFDSSQDATFTADVSLTGGSLSITADGSNAVTFTESGNGLLTIATPDDFVVDCASDIVLDTAGNDIRFRKSGVEYGKFKNDSGNFSIYSSIENEDILFKGNDAGTTITALTLDMSNAGSATFNDDIDLGGKITQTGTGTNTFSGVIALPDGSVSAPSIGNTGDTDTGMYWPGNHQLGFAVEGSRKFYMSTTEAYFQNLSSGVSISAGGIDVTGNSTFDGTITSTDLTTINLSNSGAQGGSLLLRNAAGGSGAYNRIYFAPTASSYTTRSAIIEGQNTDGNNNMSLIFKTSAGADPTEKLRIDNNGNVTIQKSALYIGNDQTSGVTEVVLTNKDTSLVDAGDIQNKLRMRGLYYDQSASLLIETQICSGHESSNGNGNSFLTLNTQSGGSSPTEKVRISSDGSIDFKEYGSGSFTGTSAYYLIADSSGNIIEKTPAQVRSDIGAGTGSGTVTGSGTTSTIPLWASSTQLTDSPLTYDGSDQIKLSAGTPKFTLYDTSSASSMDLLLNGVNANLRNNSTNGNIEITTQTGGGVGINTSGTVGSALDVNGTVRVRNQLNVGETTEQNLFVAGGSLTDGGERYAKFGFYGEAELLTPGGTASSQLADTKRTTAAFGTSGKLLEDLQYVVIKVEPAGWVNRYGDPSSNQSAILAVESYGQNTIIVLDHVTVWKSYDQGGGSNWTQGDYGGIPAYQIVQYESETQQRGGGGLVSVAWTYPAALANYTDQFAYTRPAYVGQGTERPAGQPYAIINNKRARQNRGLYIQTYENYGTARKNSNHYIRLAYRVFRRGVDFVDATALTITGGGNNGPGPGSTLTGFSRTTTPAVFNNVCSATGSAFGYHNGSGTYPVGGDNVYTTSTGTSFLAAGYYKIAANNSWFRITGGSGEVSATGSC